MSEYCLQKRTLSHWSYVTWYSDLEQAKLNFNRASQTGNGYSWRLVEVTVVEEKLLDGEREPVAETHEEAVQPVKSDWGSPGAGDWANPTIKAAPVTAPLKSEHGSVGLIWVGDPVTKIKRRVSVPEAMKLTNEGWLKVGPRTVL